MFFNEEEIKNEEVVTEEVVEETTTEEVATEEVEAAPAAKASAGTPDTAEPIAEEFRPGNFDPFARPANPRFAAQDREQEFEERVLQIKRVIKVTKGGRRFKFSALVVVGDKKGRVGYGIGKHIEVPEAIKKAVRQAKKNLVTVKITGASDTVPHEVIGHKGAARVMLKPAAEGKGVIASDNIRAVVELAGYRNIYSKNLGTNNPLNAVMATVDGLMQMKTADEIANLKKAFEKREPRPNNKKPAGKPAVAKEAKGE